MEAIPHRRPAALRLVPGALAVALGVLGPGSPAGGGDLHQTESEHLVVVAAHASVNDREIARAIEEGEAFHRAIRDLLGGAPPGRLMVSLNGPAQRPDGSWGYPHVDGAGTIQLFRFTDAPEGYLSALAHEMAHVFRRGRMPHHDWFFEEGFAELVARRVDPSLAGFPWYGFPVELVAAQWIVAGEDIPLPTLRERHRSLNLPCKLQSYSLRGSFFDWLGATHGDEKLIAMSAAPEAGALADYERFFGEPLEHLEAQWRRALVAGYEAAEGSADRARRYRQESPARYIPVCPPGGPAEG
jgi:hypothetical protein